MKNWEVNCAITGIRCIFLRIKTFNQKKIESTQLWNRINQKMAYGISSQRKKFLIRCLTSTELDQVKEQWERISEFGIEQFSENTTRTAVNVLIS